jgi:hypothetical protein
MPFSTLDFLRDDYPKTLFPLSTTLVLLINSERDVSDYLYQKVLNSVEADHSFLSQTRVFASKANLHLRRTVKLDPVAEYFIYDLVYRNRASFRKSHSSERQSFGYRFLSGRPISASKSYGSFRKAVFKAQSKYKYSLKCDVATYFNSLYHHDLVASFSDSGWSDADIKALGQFLREANIGRSVDCLPQGLYPCKMIGADFLKLIDNSLKLKCAKLIRFMDDFYLYDNDEDVINDDFLTIQRLLGEKGLSLNASKSQFGDATVRDLPAEVDGIKLSLLRLRRHLIEVSGGVVEMEEEEYRSLRPKQVSYLLNLLKEPDIDEADAELVLVLLRDHGNDVLEHMYRFFESFPSLSRNLYSFAAHVADKTELAALLLRFAKEGRGVTEDQLFWIARIAEDHLAKTTSYAELLRTLYDHSEATAVTKAKILEIPENRFSMSALREEHLKVGKSDWLAWAAAAGTRREKPISRNHLLSYFAKGSPVNKLLASCIQTLKT